MTLSASEVDAKNVLEGLLHVTLHEIPRGGSRTADFRADDAEGTRYLFEMKARNLPDDVTKLAAGEATGPIVRSMDFDTKVLE